MEGKSLESLEDFISSSLEDVDYLTDPNVSVSFFNYRDGVKEFRGVKEFHTVTDFSFSKDVISAVLSEPIDIWYNKVFKNLFLSTLERARIVQIIKENPWMKEEDCRNFGEPPKVDPPAKLKMIHLQPETLIVSPTMSWRYRDFSRDPELIQKMINSNLQVYGSIKIDYSSNGFIYPAMIALLEK
jgi:hypothetical protein